MEVEHGIAEQGGHDLKAGGVPSGFSQSLLLHQLKGFGPFFIFLSIHFCNSCLDAGIHAPPCSEGHTRLNTSCRTLLNSATFQ